MGCARLADRLADRSARGYVTAAGSAVRVALDVVEKVVTSQLPFLAGFEVVDRGDKRDRPKSVVRASPLVLLAPASSAFPVGSELRSVVSTQPGGVVAGFERRWYALGTQNPLTLPIGRPSVISGDRPRSR